LEEFVGIIESGNVATYLPEYGKIKILNTGDAITDEMLILSLHSTGHFKLEDGSKFANTTWFSDGILNQSRQMLSTSTNEGGYLGGALDSWMQNILFFSLPYHWQSIIKPVTVLANAGLQKSTVNSGVRRLYVPSIAEMGYDMTSVPYCNEIDPDANEIRFSKYTSNAQRIKKTFWGTGTEQWYWTRSACSSSDTQFELISASGYQYALSANNTYWICVGFSI